MANIDKFDAIASAYDTPERIKIAKIIISEIRGCITDAQDKTAIDFGCGTGLIGLDLLDDFQSVLFIDASLKMVQVVKEKIEQSQIANAAALCYNLEESPPGDMKADYIILGQVLLHIRDIEPFLEKLSAMLNIGGHLIIVDFNKNDAVVSQEIHNGFEQGELGALLIQMGFHSIKSRTFYHGEKIFCNEDASLFLLETRK